MFQLDNYPAIVEGRRTDTQTPPPSAHTLPRHPPQHTPSATTAEPTPCTAHVVPGLLRHEHARPPHGSAASALHLATATQTRVSQRPTTATHNLPVTAGTKYAIRQHSPEPHGTPRFSRLGFAS